MDGYWTNHSLLFLIGLTIFPRFTLLFSNISSNILFWLGWLFLPRLMIALLGITTVYYFMTFLYILATIIISFLPITKSLNPHAKEKSPIRDLIDGFKYIFNERISIIKLFSHSNGL